MISNLRDKTRYVTHYHCLQFYLAHGLVLDKIHRIVAFFLSVQVHAAVHHFCNDGRKNVQSEFDSSLYKLIVNAFYGKTVENMQKHANVRLTADPTKFVCSISKVSYKCSSIINADLMVENVRTKAVLSKLITVGCAILEARYEFDYDCQLPAFGDRLRLCYTDTDSFVCHIESKDLVGKLGVIADRWLGTSNFEPTHLLYSSANFRTLGKFKSETADVPPTEFCGLHLKMYSLTTLTGNREHHKVKGVPKSYVKKHVTHEQYLQVLRCWSQTTCRFRAFRSRNHRVTTSVMSKVCLSCVDDKRYLLTEAINSLAYGHHNIASTTGN